MTAPTVPARRPPPPFEAVSVVETFSLGPRLRRITVAGDSLAGFEPDGPAASVRLLLPERDGIVLPEWNDNEFLLPDGRRPGIRSLTPGRRDPIARTLELMVVIHGGGRLSTWAGMVEPGAPTAYSGPGRGYTIDPDADRFLLAGDETALPAIMQLMEEIPGAVAVDVIIEVAAPEGRVALPDRSGATVTWVDLAPHAPPGAALVDAVLATDTPADGRVWVAGEAAAVQRIRRDMFEQRKVPRAHCTIRGYWKHGRDGT